jgi:phosphopantetheine adenylyltransferase
MKKKYSLYIGCWQNFHAGHEWLLNQQLDKGKNVWIAIRDVEVDENNPKDASDIMIELMNNDFIKKHSDRIIVSIIPNIESVNYSGGVGYDVIYHEPPVEIGEISSTKIRNDEIDRNGDNIYF